VHIAGIAKALEKLGHRVVFSSPSGVDPRQSAGSDPFAGKGRGGFWSAVARYSPKLCFELMEIAYNAFAYVRNARLLRQKQFDAIYERHAFFLCATGILARRHSIPLIVEVNELVGDARIRAQPFLSRVAAWCDRTLFARADVVVVVSPHLKRRISELGVDSGKILVLPNAVDSEALDYGTDAEAIRVGMGLSGKTVIGFVGWLVHWHSLDTFLDAFADLAKTNRNLALMLVGDGPLREEIETQAREAGISERLVITGAVPHADVAQRIAAMDIAVIPHSNEYRSPIKLFEYMAQGKAVVAPGTEPIRMVLRDGENGVVFEPGDSTGLEAGLVRLIGDRELRAKMGKAARTDVASTYTWEQNARAVLAALPTVSRDSVAEEC